MALGAQRSSVVWLVLKEGFFLTLPGLVAGVASATICTKLLERQFFGVASDDVANSAVVVSLLLMGVTAAATCIPARRAATTDPMSALRHE
jgi:ABC-type lipoprotein release transport system permease subunit